MKDTWYDMGFDADMSWMYDWKGKEKKMTIDEAIDILEEVKELDDSIYQYNTKYLKALNMVIKAAKQQSMSIVTSTKDNAEMTYPQVEGITPMVVEPIPDVDKEVEKYRKMLKHPVIKHIMDMDETPVTPSVSEKPNNCDLISRGEVLENAFKIYTHECGLLEVVGVATIKTLPSVKPQELKWIPVSERLPEEETAVMISCEDLYLHRLNPCIGWRNGQYWNTFTANGCKQILYPTAWMPLPKPYELPESEE